MANAPCELCGSLGGPDHACPATLLGKVLDGRYQLDGVLGQGGMGMVFSATQIAIKRQVAVKTLNPSLAAAPTFFERFRREAEVSSRLRHPNIITIFDFGRAQDGTCYFVMELVPGESLKQVVKSEGPLSLRRAQAIVEQAGRGLAHAHAENVVHRDIKPHNLLISSVDGKEFVKILDFGLVKAMEQEDEDQLTSTGQVLGTPQYMPPEQAGGELVDRRSDLYALGAVLYFCLTGASPFGANTVRKALTAALTQPVPPLATRRHGAPAPKALDEFFRKALAADKEDRHQSAADFLADLQSALSTCTPEELDAIPEPPDPYASRDASAGTGPSSARSPTSSPSSVKRQASNVIVDPQLTVSKPRATAPEIPSLRLPQAAAQNVERTAVGPPPRSGKPLLWIALPAVLLVGGAALVLKLRAATPPAPEIVSVDGPAAHPAQTGTATPTAGTGASSAVTVHLHTSPTGAEVYDGDALLGHTELDLHLTRDRPHTLTFRLAGYQAEPYLLDLSSYPNPVRNVDVALRPLPRSETRSETRPVAKKKKDEIHVFE